ncbi:hypothetical protein CWO04_00350 [Vibrio splendidus]|nr:hypothetical protein [Vibrio splendidus]PMO22903.1 hypothetical protein BCT15_11435 [Vibrio splendidus]PTP90673.1 hypothetical protein CWO04_00350 [Vibrio splendidus]
MEELVIKNTITMIGVMFAAIVGGFFSLMNLVSSKEQKVSEFRQDWINSLRESISSYIASLYYLSTLYKHYVEQHPDKKNRFEMTKGVEETYSQVNKMYNDIIFRINENEKKPHLKKLNDDFLAALEESRDLFNKNEFKEVKVSCNKVRSYAKPLLKIEWERVKSGEPAYRYSKYFSVAILVVGVSIFSYTSYKIIDTALVSPSQTETVIESKPNKSSNADGDKAAASS